MLLFTFFSPDVSIHFSDELISLCTHRYGTFVIQKLIEIGNRMLVQDLYDRIQRYLGEMRQKPSGRIVFEKIHQKLTGGQQQQQQQTQKQQQRKSRQP